jgi:Competence protein CoiA-like family
MLKALFQDTLINLVMESPMNNRSFLKSDPVKNSLTCSYCRNPVRIRWAEIPLRIPHFSHEPGIECPYHQNQTGESPSHRIGKIKLFHYFHSLLAHKIHHMDIEHFFHETGQIADIYIEFKNGHKWVVEYQRSNIPAEQINKRRQQYSQMNIKDIWVVGENLINENGMVTYSVKRAAEELIQNEFGQPSLVSFNPDTEQIRIYRGLYSQNQRTYTVSQYVTEMPLDEIGVNLYGEFFGLDDVATVKFPRHEYPQSSLSFNTEPTELIKAEVPGYQFSYMIKNEHDDLVPLPLAINRRVLRLVPVEMKDVVLKCFVLYKHEKVHHDENELVVESIIKASWGKFIDKKLSIHVDMDYMKTPVRYSTLLLAIDHIYDTIFQTKKEMLEDIELMGQPVPFYKKNYRYQKYKLIKKPFIKKNLPELISFYEAVEALIYVVTKQSTAHPMDKALSLGIVKKEEVDKPFNLELFEQMVIRTKKRIIPPAYAKEIQRKGVGLFYEKDGIRKSYQEQ